MDKQIKIREVLTGEGDGVVDGEDTGFATLVTELAVGITGEDFSAVTTEELEGGGGEGEVAVGVERRSDHDVLGVE